MKIRPVEAKLFHADGRTDTTKLIAAFCNFANAPKNIQTSVLLHRKYWTSPQKCNCLMLFERIIAAY